MSIANPYLIPVMSATAGIVLALSCRRAVLLSDRRSQRRWASFAAALLAVVAGLGWFAGLGTVYFTSRNSAIDPSGQAMPVGNIPGWTQVFADDFAENVPVGKFPAAVSGKWTAYPDGWHDTSGHGTYEPSKVVSIHNGVMDLYLHTQSGVHMVAAPEPVIPGASGKNGGLLYGRYVVRFKADPVPGYKTAWLLWPDSGRWSDGEIDFPEGNLNSTFNGFMHHRGNPRAQDTYSTGATYGTWHTAVIQWTPHGVTFFLDGRVIGVSTNAANIPDTPMHWVLQTETQLSGGPPSNSVSGHVLIAWVVVYVPRRAE